MLFRFIVYVYPYQYTIRFVCLCMYTHREYCVYHIHAHLMHTSCIPHAYLMHSSGSSNPLHIYQKADQPSYINAKVS